MQGYLYVCNNYTKKIFFLVDNMIIEISTKKDTRLIHTFHLMKLKIKGFKSSEGGGTPPLLHFACCIPTSFSSPPPPTPLNQIMCSPLYLGAVGGVGGVGGGVVSFKVTFLEQQQNCVCFDHQLISKFDDKQKNLTSPRPELSGQTTQTLGSLLPVILINSFQASFVLRSILSGFLPITISVNF